MPSKAVLYRAGQFLIFGIALAHTCMVANREYGDWGKVLSVTLVLGIWLSIVAMTRLPVTAAFVITCVLAALDGANALKQTLLLESLTFYDFLVVSGLGLKGATDMAVSYIGRMGGIPIFVLAALVFTAGLAYTETCMRRQSTQPLWRRALLLLTGMVLIANFGASLYVDAMASQNIPFSVAQRRPILLTSLAAGLRSHMDLRRQLSSPQIGMAAADPRPCAECPDIVLFHVESTFDPTITKAYATSEDVNSYLDRAAPGLGGLLEVAIWGGFSWISEFEILCGVDHRLFGRAGTAPSITIAPLIKHCLPSHLKSIGYDTVAIYSTARTWLNVASAFKRYGIDTFYDLKDLGIEGHVAWSIDDRPFVDKAIDLLEQPRDRPQFLFVSSMWNHGPHGRPLTPPLNAGPFDVAAASDAPFRDYINRMNLTLTHLTRLLQYASSRKKRVAVVLYGDHQPGITLEYRPEIINALGDRARFLTFFRVNGGEGTGKERVPKIEGVNLGRFVLSHLNLPPSPALEGIARVAQSCGGGQRTCSSADQQKIRSMLVGE